MQDLAQYADIVADVRRELGERVEAAHRAGIGADQIVIDPGLGFAKTAAHNWALLAHLDVLVGLGLPVLVGASRKSFLGRVLADPDGTPRPVDDREAATVALTAYAAAQGVWGVRVHDVQPNVDAARTIAAVREAATR
jgi:dihydropteroate synthase